LIKKAVLLLGHGERVGIDLFYRRKRGGEERRRLFPASMDRNKYSNNNQKQ